MEKSMKCFGIIGWPLAQTLSPLVHNTGFKALEFPGAFFSWPIQPENLDLFMRSFRLLDIAGCSVTIPHKIDVMNYLDVICEPARIAGAVNTLFWKDGLLHGENTDVAGFLEPLKNISSLNGPALLLGAGGAAHAVCAGLLALKLRDIYIASPGNKRQYELARKFSLKALDWDKRYEIEATLVINATPMGMVGKNIGVSAYDFAKCPAAGTGIAYDLVYNPLETVFLANAAINGWRCISGLEMFYWQANGQFMHWTQEPLPLASRIALEDALGVKV